MKISDNFLINLVSSRQDNRFYQPTEKIFQLFEIVLQNDNQFYKQRIIQNQDR